MLRLFAAIYPPVELAQAMLDRAAMLEASAHGRLVPAQQVHITVQFIGDTLPRELPDVEEALARSASGLDAFDLVPQKLMTFPPSGRAPARLIAAVTDAPPTLLELHRRLAARFARPRRGSLAVEKDRFTPHLTLCRFAGGRRVVIDEPLASLGFRVESVALMRSVLRPDRAEHAEVVRVPLAG